MYLRRFHIKNIRSIDEIEWEIAEGKEAGWHVIIGDNGAGKSTLLKAIALGLIGPQAASALRENWGDWIRSNWNEGIIQLDTIADKKYDKYTIQVINIDKVDRSHNPPRMEGHTETRAIDGLVKVGIKLVRNGQGGGIGRAGRLKNESLDHYLWGADRGCFSASYGPFRRFKGGDSDLEKIYHLASKLPAHLSIFGENVALTETISWLQELQFKSLENDPGGLLLDFIVMFINQDGFLPHKTKLGKISSGGVTFIDGNHCEVGVEVLSDGYRSILSMTFELIRQMSRVYTLKEIFGRSQPGKITAPGVVLIDEIDAHLHPTWQRRIGMWFREHFPNVQFIVTTHSPLICQAAEVGTVWRLPKPGTEEKAKMITGTDLERLLHGNVLDAYGTELFGENVARSEKSQEMMDRLAELNLKEMNAGLTKKEEREQAQLRAAMPTTAHQTSKRNRRNGHD